jgi:prophage endopeptidase
MPFINLKFAAIAALLIAFIAFAMHYDHLKEQNKILTADNEQYAKTAESAARQVKLADEARTDYLNKLTEAENEISNLRGRVESGAVRLRIKATCPKLPAASTNPAGAVTESPELDRDARSAYYAHLTQIAKADSLLKLCVKTLQDDRK